MKTIWRIAALLPLPIAMVLLAFWQSAETERLELERQIDEERAGRLLHESLASGWREKALRERATVATLEEVALANRVLSEEEREWLDAHAHLAPCDIAAVLVYADMGDSDSQRLTAITGREMQAVDMISRLTPDEAEWLIANALDLVRIRGTSPEARAAHHAEESPVPLGDTPEEIAWANEAARWLFDSFDTLPDEWANERLSDLATWDAGRRLTGAMVRGVVRYLEDARQVFVARAAELDRAEGRGSWAHGPNLFKSLSQEEFDRLPRPSINDIQRALDAGRPRDSFAHGPTDVLRTVDRQGDPSDYHAPGFDGCKPPATPRRCAFDGRLKSDTKAPDGGWAWSTVGGKDVCSERCRQREEARQREWAPDSAAHITKPLGGDP